MSLHIMKLCVGCSSVEELAAWIDCSLAKKRAQGKTAEQIHTTRMTPRRISKPAEGNSLYWIIKGNIQCRQRLLDIRPFTDAYGIRRCHLLLEPRLITTQWQPRRPFQGWRYLKAEEIPPDEDERAEKGLPAALRQELAELGLL